MASAADVDAFLASLTPSPEAQGERKPPLIHLNLASTPPSTCAQRLVDSLVPNCPLVCCLCPVAEEARIVAAANLRIEQERRQRGLRDGLFTGFRCGTSLRFRNVQPSDAKAGNLVVLDVRSAGNDDAALLGEWERSHMFGRVLSHQGEKNTENHHLKVLFYEPWVTTADGQPERPLWAEVQKAQLCGGAPPPTDLKSVLALPWLVIEHMPVGVCCHTYAVQQPRKQSLVAHFRQSGQSAVRLPKPGFFQLQPAGSVTFVMQFDEKEAKKSSFRLNMTTQSELLDVLHATELAPLLGGGGDEEL